MSNKYQIFISSTYKDLQTARKKVIDVILSMGHFPVGMEMFGARDEEQWEVIKKKIDSSDYYIVIVGRCFGSQVPNEDISYTQKEFRYAKEIGIPILAFVASNKASIAKTYQDSDLDKIEKLNLFIKELEDGRVVDYWKNYDNLATKVALSLPNVILSHPMPGWVRLEGEHSKLYNGREKITLRHIIEKSLIDYKWVESGFNRLEAAAFPWTKFRPNNVVVCNDRINPHSYDNDLTKAELYDIVDDGVLIFSNKYGSITVIQKYNDEGSVTSKVPVFILYLIPFCRINSFDECGNTNMPYPTFYCDYSKGGPFDEEWYVDKDTGIRYKDEDIVSRSWEQLEE